MKKKNNGSFDIFSDIDSRIKHLNQIGNLIGLVAVANVLIGVANTHIGFVNLLCASLLMYALGRIHGKKEVLEKERLLHE